MKWLLRKVAALLLVILSTIASADYGPRYVEKTLPDFYKVLLQIIAYDRTQLFFKEWTVIEVEEFRSLQEKYVDKHIPQRGKVPAPIELFELAGEKIFSSLGELYGASRLRARAREQRSLHFLSEATYRRLNWGSYRNPDGLLYRFDGDDLYIVSVLESKLGRSSRVSDAQTQGLIDQWSKRGIQVLTASGRVQFFSNRNIYLGEKDSRMPVGYVNTNAVKSITTLVSHRERPDFPGYVLPPPFSPIDGRNVVFNYFERLVENREWGSRNQDSYGDVTSEKLLPVVKDWIVDRRTWPKESGRRVEKLLARNIRFFGGQSAVFLELDAEHQELLAQAGMIPALGSLHNTFMRLRTRTPGALRAFRYFANTYFSNEPIEMVLARFRENLLFRFIHPRHIPTTCQLKISAHSTEE